MVILKRYKDWLVVAEGPAKMFWAITYCPGCGIPASLSKANHSVSPEGRVTPSYVCPNPPCTFHDWVTLEEWRDGD